MPEFSPTDMPDFPADDGFDPDAYGDSYEYSDGGVPDGGPSAPGPGIGQGHNPAQDAPAFETPLDVLRAVFGFDAFIGRQADVVEHVSGGGDALVLMPTGGGKSVCYQIPAILRPGVGIVVSPLIALMQDQVQGLRQMGVRAAALHSGLAAQEAFAVQRAMREGRLDLLYVAPERLCRPDFLDLLASLPLALFAIDEAHCVSQWGHDFRPEYLQLAVLHERFPQVPRLALTATADGPTRKDIIRNLRLEGALEFATGFDRPNIRYHVLSKDGGRNMLLRFVKERHAGDAGIVYRMSRRKVEETAAWLCKEGVEALPYHAGLPAEQRARNQDRFMREEGLVMVATIAFGMGVDKPNVRFVAHLDPPKSLEAYHQETGRAGRDGLPADAWMTYGLQDVAALSAMLENGGGDDERRRVEQLKLRRLLDFCETASCRRQALLGYFGEDRHEPCGNCDNCLNPPETFDGTVAAQKALSNIYRTGQYFGATHLAHVLTGKRTDKVLERGHEDVSTFGIGAELDVDGWKSVYRQLAAAGLLTVDFERHGALRLNDRSWTVLRGETDVRLRKDPVQPKRRAKATSSKIRDNEILNTSEAVRLWEALRARRLELAREQAVPPYAILADRSLLDMVRLRPRSVPEMGNIHGVGEVKLRRFGQTFLDVLNGHEAAEGRAAVVAGLESAVVESAAAGGSHGPRGSVSAKKLSKTAAESARLLLELGTAAAVAEARGLTEPTIWNHLLSAVESGTLEARTAAGLPAASYDCVAETIRVFEDEGYTFLSVVFEALDRAVDYGLLRCVRLGLENEAG